MLRSLLRPFLHLCFGYRVEGAESLRTPGPVLLIPNHVSWLDWLFLYATLEDDWKFVASSTTAETSWFHRKFMINDRTFPVDPTSPYAVRDMAEYLEKGGRLVLFAEGRISLTGALMKIYPGTGFLIGRTGARVITCYLQGAVRAPFVRHEGWTKWFPRVRAHFSPALTAPSWPGLPHATVRQKVTDWLHMTMMRQQVEAELAHGPQNLLTAGASIAAAIPNREAFEDISFKTTSFRRVMVGTDVLAGVWRRRFTGGAGERIGVMLPNATATPVTLFSLWAAQKVPAILNFSAGIPTMIQCARLAGLKQIITSRQFLTKAKLPPEPFAAAGLELICLEDVRAGVSRLTQLAALGRHTLACGRRFHRVPLQPDDTAVILYTSGSEGTPKGVELSHRNVYANVQQAIAIIDLVDDDRWFNAMPLFHSFGFTATMLAFLRGNYTFYYPTPLHYRIVPELVYDKVCTVMMGTNTFLNGYARKAHEYDFNSVKYMISGAEKVQSATVDTYARKFGVRIIEGYGITECSPIVSANSRLATRHGTSGRLAPGMECRLEPVEGVTEGGRLFVRGPNLMKGYLNPESNAAFQALGGWYDTGDIVSIDDDGFITIRGRAKRFAKLSGEMVSLTAIEDALAGAFPQYGARCAIAIVAVPDPEKGERIVAATNEARLQLADVRAMVRSKGLSNLCAPRELRVVHAIPKLGSGKTDHRELVRQLSEADAAAATS